MVSFSQVSVSGHLRCQWQSQGELPTTGHHSGCVQLIHCSPALHGALVALRLRSSGSTAARAIYPGSRSAVKARLFDPLRDHSAMGVAPIAVRDVMALRGHHEMPSRRSRGENRGLARERATARLRHWRFARGARLPAQ